MSDETGHLQCPFCHSYDVQRLYLASERVDACECGGCGARWDENSAPNGGAGRVTVLAPRAR